jgi:hypothetical protein
MQNYILAGTRHVKISKNYYVSKESTKRATEFVCIVLCTSNWHRGRHASYTRLFYAVFLMDHTLQAEQTIMSVPETESELAPSSSASKPILSDRCKYYF